MKCYINQTVDYNSNGKDSHDTCDTIIRLTEDSPFLKLPLPVDHDSNRQDNHDTFDLVGIKQAREECNHLDRLTQSATETTED